MEETQLTRPKEFCANCGREYPAEDLLLFRNSHICAECKPAFEQRLREGTDVTWTVEYASIGRRFAALVLDALILAIINITITALLRVTPGASGGVLAAVSLLVNFAISLGYHVYFLTKYGATPGKMAWGIKVVTAAGSPISAGVAIGRYFVQYWLEVFTLLIGYLIACFDDQHRTLHDRICGTRVVKAR